MLLQFLVVFIKFTELIRQDIGVWHEVKVLLTKSLLHSNNVEAEPIFSCDFVALREMVNFLILVETLI